MSNFLKNNLLILAFLFISLLSIKIIPSVDKFLFPETTGPTLFTYVGVGLSILICMAFTLYFVLKNSFGLLTQFIIYTLVYNAIVVIVKFSLAPASLYLVAKNFGDKFVWEKSVSNEFMALCTTLFICSLYLLVFRSIYKDFLKKTQNKLSSPQNNASDENNTAKIVFYQGLGLFLVFSFGSIPFFFLFLFLQTTNAINYFISVFYSTLGLPIALLLIIATRFAKKSFNSLSEQAILLKDATILTSFLWIGFSFILAYHFLVNLFYSLNKFMAT